jgi:hypothetical protein
MVRNQTLTSRWSRRAFLGSLVASLSYLLYRVAAHNQWIIVTRGGRSFTVGVEPTLENGKDQFSMLVVGDTGKDTFRRTDVVSAMRRHVAWSRPDAAMLLGDNFYERGVDSVDDPRFDQDFESLFDARSFEIPFLATRTLRFNTPSAATVGGCQPGITASEKPPGKCLSTSLCSTPTCC